MFTRFKNWFVSHTKGWRTVAFNILAIAAPVLLTVLDKLALVDMSGTFGTAGAILWATFVPMVNVYLRSITTTAVGCDGCEAK